MAIESVIDVVFENCDYVTLSKEQNVHVVLRVTTEDYRAEFYTLGKYTYNYFSTHQRASWCKIYFDKSALDKNTNFGYSFLSYLKDKDITHIDIKYVDGKDFYIAVPYLPVTRKYGIYNLYQREKFDNNTVTITFSKRNLWGNLPKAALWWIKWTIKNIKRKIRNEATYS